MIRANATSIPAKRGAPVEDRLLSFVDAHSLGCWNWTGAKDKDGYGVIRIKGKNIRSHRCSFEIFHNVAIGREDMVCHSCDNPSCINPDHLWIGDNSSNQIDAVKKGRNGSQKLSFDDVSMMRRLYFSGERTQSSLCDEYGISTGNMSSIINRRKWAHVD